jgi:hypothetical protein
MAWDEELDAWIRVGRLAPLGMPADFDKMAPQLPRLGGQIHLLDATGQTSYTGIVHGLPIIENRPGLCNFFTTPATPVHRIRYCNPRTDPAHDAICRDNTV